MESITLKLSPEEIQLIFQALGEMPYKEVVTLVHKINQQASPQLNAEQNAPKS